jgi:hypothetical protein
VPDQEPDYYSRNRAWAKPGSYETKLPPAQEQMFQAWVFKNQIPFDAGQKSPQDYDMRGFWRAMMAGDPIAAQDPGTMHFPDRWKTPYHETFSNESMYAKPDAPRWKGDMLVDKSGKTVWAPPQ